MTVTIMVCFYLHSVISITPPIHLIESRAFFMYETFVLLGMNLCGLHFFNLSINMDIPLTYLRLYLNVSVPGLRQPKLSFLC